MVTLLISLLAAVVSTSVWYKEAPQDPWKVSTLCWLFWGASLMWGVDAAFAFAKEGAASLHVSANECLQEGLLGMAVVVLALVIWLARLLVADPRGVFRRKSS